MQLFSSRQDRNATSNYHPPIPAAGGAGNGEPPYPPVDTASPGFPAVPKTAVSGTEDLRRVAPRHRTHSIGAKFSRAELTRIKAIARDTDKRLNTLVLEAIHIWDGASPEVRERVQQEVLAWIHANREQDTKLCQRDMRKVHAKKRGLTAHLKLSEPERDRITTLAVNHAMYMNDLILDAVVLWEQSTPQVREAARLEVKRRVAEHSRTFRPKDYDDEDAWPHPI